MSYIRLTMTIVLLSQGMLHASQPKKVCLCKLEKPKNQKPFFIYIDHEYTQKPRYFAVMCRVFKSVHGTDAFMVWNGTKWSHHSQEAQGFTRQQLHTFFQEEGATSTLAKQLGLDDFQALQYKWNHKYHGKVVTLVDRKRVDFQTKDTYFFHDQGKHNPFHSVVWDDDHNQRRQPSDLAVPTDVASVDTVDTTDTEDAPVIPQPTHDDPLEDPPYRNTSAADPLRAGLGAVISVGLVQALRNQRRKEDKARRKDQRPASKRVDHG